jgi:hypothetical protein
MKAVKWPGSISEDEKVRIWKEFLSPRFKRAFCLERNRINVFINFMIKYGRFSAPKAVLEGAMKEAQLACYERNPDKEEDGDFTAGFECLTKSVQVYPIFVFMNCEEDWETKREHLHDKSIS